MTILNQRSRMLSGTALVALLTVAAPSLSWAQDTAPVDQDEATVDEIVVTA